MDGGPQLMDKFSEEDLLSVVVFGASGDLAKKKTFPALFNLYCQVKNQLHVLLLVIFLQTKPKVEFLVLPQNIPCLALQGFLSPEQVQIFGYARSTLTDEEIRDRLSR